MYDTHVRPEHQRRNNLILKQLLNCLS